MPALRHIPNRMLYVSEPSPHMFGNPANADRSVNWLKSRFHFSFAEYRDPKNSNFGVLRVMNDDLVQADRGFGTHPHANMEIITYVVHGSLTHKDSMGTAETLGKGSVQFMTAGTGIQHSEYNASPTDTLRFIQSWVVPARQGLKPNYGSRVGDLGKRKNQWQHLVASVNNDSVDDSVIKVHQDVNFHATEMEAGTCLEFPVGPRRQAYMLCIEGRVKLESEHGSAVLDQHDAAAITEPATWALTAESAAHVLVVEMAKST